ncbi:MULTISPECIES: YigZ family protein [unclassified Caballeronia]|uniref:IMPACT family protein n=1 Tax=unclassified Caballeronia TaxID=2646786 RepID=UPI0028613B4E|nr:MULTISPECIES: YigZ family protein [unclassified Caballeronia]MDR5750298.1 IMPACT family protein [Caballeronia sp. LZ024]MDR5844969.1 IMPACT family protein [Caballeronia sp. LZ031]
MPTYTLAAAVAAELDIRKSRFIARALPVPNRESAMRELDALRAEHPGATHVCWALLAGGQSGMSDDGEPSGTAGRPILEVLRHHEVDGVLATVVRYYGGIKLGAGGLVRAYTDAIATAMLKAERIERIERGLLTVEVDYADEARVRRWIEQHDCELAEHAYAMSVRLVIRMPSASREAATAELRDLTHGRAAIAPDTP